MSFTIKAPKKIRKQIEPLDSKMKQRLDELFLVLKENPVPADLYDVEKISGSDYTYRIRLTQIRVIYDVLWKEKEIWPLKIERRKDRTYKNF
ncbi:MAG: hypothetical protein AABW85_06215 [archaeon]